MNSDRAWQELVSLPQCLGPQPGRLDGEGALAVRNWSHLSMSSHINVTRAGMMRRLCPAGAAVWSTCKWPLHAASK